MKFVTLKFKLNDFPVQKSMFSVRTRTCFANENAETKNLSSSQAGVLLENTDVGLCREVGRGRGGGDFPFRKSFVRI